MTEVPKYLAAIKRDGHHLLVGPDRFCDYASGSPSMADAQLARAGQRAIWPEGHGVAVIEDIPKPAPLPTAYLIRHKWSGVTCWHATPGGVAWVLVATITFDEDGNPHREDHQ